MGTSYAVSFVGEVDLDALAAKIHAAVDGVDCQMSNWKPDSDVSRFNRAAVGEWVDVSADLAFVVGEGLKIAEQTGGAFDMTIGPILALWGFGPARVLGRQPTDEALNAAADLCGFEHIVLRAGPPALRKSGPCTLDLCGIAKGFGVDKIVQVIEEEGICDYLVAIDGEVRLRGTKGFEPWSVALEAPLIERREAWDILQPPVCAIATSGDYRKIRYIGDERFSHTIDPRTHRPTDGRLASVTVIAESCMISDAWATALMVLGPEQGVALAQKLGLSTLFLVRNGAQIDDHMTGHFAAFIGG
ncbi:MAG: FAD:protein FMN transferase [Deltaproteobacteria bacterium]